ncbi:autotransporter domain-containing protein [uncultured Deefgea sp.]|uniref:autotransporter domain-containing protein n=1 Tax=uncultured Deefgea sp. TaxID=1304914 RepID=UPI0026174458|nr:autotransporter domain-containing protein [uncultured Deefgea sp.]
MRKIGLVLILGFSLALPAWANDKKELHLLPNSNVQRSANAVLSLMSYSVILDLAASSLSIKGAQSENNKLMMTQLGGGSTISKDLPLYLEGALAGSRFDPTFVATNGEQERAIPLKWTSVSGTGGIGWDFPLAENWVLRPIVNFSLGTVASDLKIANWWINYKTGKEFNFFDKGSMNVYGLGGALMLDYELVKPEYEVDLELRLSQVHLKTFKTDAAVSGSATSQTANLWTRYRAPTGLTFLSRPLRYVLEASHSHYYGDQAGVLGFDYLSTVGLGFEVDSSAHAVFVTRTRFLMRYMFGPNVSGSGMSIAMSF